MRYLVIAAVMGFAMAITVALPPPGTVHACSLAPISDNRERFSAAFNGSYAVLLAEILEQHTVHPAVRQEAQVATFQVGVLLAGSQPTGKTLGPLGGLGADCSGGPPFEPGNKVLLFLRLPQPHLSGVADYETGVIGETVLFRGSEAFLLHPNREPEPTDASAWVLQTVMQMVGGTVETRRAAFEYLGLDPNIQPQPPGIRPPVTGSGGLR